MAAASAVVDFYKERAKSLCQSIYNATGALPQFPNTSGEAQAKQPEKCPNKKEGKAPSGFPSFFL